MKKKVFFLLSYMNVGGVEKSFLNLLGTIDRSQYDIHLGLFRKEGGYLNEIPYDIPIREIRCYEPFKSFINDPPKKVIKDLIQRGNVYKAITFFLAIIKDRVFHTRINLYNYILRDSPIIDENFDIAISYSSPSEMNDYFLIKKIKAKNKYVWIHFDIEKFGYNQNLINQLYKEYDKIFIVSKEARDIFDKSFPKLSHKTEVKYNVVNKEAILKESTLGPTYQGLKPSLRILTVGRISSEKGQDLAIKAAYNLKKEDIDFKWYFIGEGPQLAQCQTLVSQLDLKNNVEFLGLQRNPYGYFKDCDIYVQPSLHEGFCIALAEALCFNKPIVATNFSGAHEQLHDKPNSRIVDANEYSISKAIIDLYQSLI